MKKIFVIMSAAITIVFAAYAASTVWTAKTESATIRFKLPDEGTEGTLSGLKTKIDFDEKNPGNSSIIASVEVKTFDTGNEKKDVHMKSSDFFDAEKYPLITFSSKQIIITDGGFLARGTLAIKDSIKPIEIPFIFKNDGKNGVFQGSLAIFASDYGVTKKGKSEGKDKVEITLEVPVSK